MKLEKIAYGGDFNPEQWDDAIVDEDILLMQEAGVNLVSLGIFSWAKLEPAEGQYELDWLAGVIDKLHAGGIDVDLATATASPPAWMAQNYPESLPVTAEGVRLGFGSRQQYCPNSPVYRRAAAALVRQLATRFGAHPAVKLWHIGNEYGCHVAECYCDVCAVAFREWLAAKYQTVDALNQAWGTAFWSQTYTAFEQITPPRAMPTFHNPTQMLDWRRFMNDSIYGCFATDLSVLSEVCPDVPVTTNFMGLYPPLDYQQWARDVDVVSDDSYPEPANPAAAAGVAFEADLARSYKRKPFILMEQAPAGMVQWRRVNSPKRPRQNRLWSMQRVARGADGILHFQWRQSAAGSETFHAGMVPHGGTDTRIWREIVELGQDLSKLTPVLDCEITTPVALLWSWDSEWARDSAIGPRDFTFGAGLRDWHRTCYEAGFVVDIVAPEQLDERYQVIIVPQVFALLPDVIARLSDLATAGAQVLVAAPSGVVDADLHAWLGANVPLSLLTGVRVIEHWCASERAAAPGAAGRDEMYRDPCQFADRITRAVGAPSQEPSVWIDVVENSATVGQADDLATAVRRIRTDVATDAMTPPIRANVWAESLELLDAEAIATYAGCGSAADIAGQPAITRRKLGDGQVFYVSADLGAIGRATLLRIACAAKSVTPSFGFADENNLPDGVEIVARGALTFMINHSDVDVTVPNVMAKAASNCGSPGVSATSKWMDLLSGVEIGETMVIPKRDIFVIAAV